MGVRRDARRAGKTPKNTPMAEDMPKVIRTENKLIDAGKNILTTKTINPAANKPANPPKTESIKLSVKNCNRISF